MRKALPPREKLIKGRDAFPETDDSPPGLPELPNTVAEYHLYCAGEGCDDRLAKRTVSEDKAGRSSNRITLEPRYTNEPHERYPAGTWWRASRGGYKGMARNRDIRKAGGIPRSPGEDFLSPETQRTVHMSARVKLGEADPDHPRARPRRDDYRPPLPPGVHTVVCYKCQGLTRIDYSRYSA